MRALVAQTQRRRVIGLVHGLEAVQNLVTGGDHRCGHDALECDVALQVEEVLLLSVHGIFLWFFAYDGETAVVPMTAQWIYKEEF